jgi:hypothetical protein
LRIGASLRHLATGEPYSSLETSFQISKTVLVDFCHKFLKWFLKYYYTMYVGGLSGVGFDTKGEIEENELRVFRALVLPGSSRSWTQCTWPMTGPPFLLGISS